MSHANAKSSLSVAIIGGGPAGLMAAEIVSQAGARAEVFDAMPSVGRKLLMAGKSGLNITHAEPYQLFLSRYGASQAFLKPMLDAFGPDALRQWARGLGIETFTGTSLRVFPREMKAAPLLRAWMHRLRVAGVKFNMRHQWQGWADDGITHLRFSTLGGIREIRADAVILAMGGASWPSLGSTGGWSSLLKKVLQA